MKKLLIPALFLVGCGGSGTTPPSATPPFTAPSLVNGVYAGSALNNNSNTGNIPMNLTIASGNIIYSIEGYPPITCPRDWTCNADFDGTPAQFQLQKSETGYKGYIYREGFNWNTRVYSAWRLFKVE